MYFVPTRCSTYMTGHLSYKRLNADPSVYFRKWEDGSTAIAGFYVDNCTATGDETRLRELEKALDEKWGISGKGELTWTLGIGFKRDLQLRTISLSQETFVDQ